MKAARLLVGLILLATLCGVLGYAIGESREDRRHQKAVITVMPKFHELSLYLYTTCERMLEIDRTAPPPAVICVDYAATSPDGKTTLGGMVQYERLRKVLCSNDQWHGALECQSVEGGIVQ